MLILATLSGIQDYLFDVRETGGGQARALRARSFRIQLYSECIARRILGALGLGRKQVILRAAAKFVIDAGSVDDTQVSRIEGILADVHQQLRDETHGRLRLSVALSGSSGSTASDYADAQTKLARNKLRPWGSLAVTGSGWASGQLVVRCTLDADAQADRDKALGRVLPESRFLSFGRLRDDEDRADAEDVRATIDVAGLSVRLRAETHGRGGWEDSEPIDRFAFHIPTDNEREPVEFVELASRSRGAAMLGVLKADVDSLGSAVSNRLRGCPDLRPLQELSNRLSEFFGSVLNAELRSDDRRWRDLYTIFAGGDDVLLVGPWDVAIDFAGHLRRLFEQRFGKQDRLTISAGVAVVKPKFPIRLAAAQAESLLHEAKSNRAPNAAQPKDQFAALGGLWKWQDHERIITAGKQLADWVERAGVIQRGWLHTLLELALLRRGQAGPEYSGVHPAIATSRLAYHVSRNWQRSNHPRDERQRAQNAARDWIDSILRDFDQFDSTSHTDAIHLPTIVRYALLATRSGASEDHL